MIMLLFFMPFRNLYFLTPAKILKLLNFTEIKKPPPFTEGGFFYFRRDG
jgi:hypothetical protein